MQQSKYKALTLLAMIYITIVLAADVLIYKITTIGNLTFSVGSFIVPFWFILADDITEVYGYDISKKVVLYALFCTFIFSIACQFLIHLPSPQNWLYQSAYVYIFGDLLRIFIGAFLGVLLGSFVNIYLVSRWKAKLKGKYFPLRSIFSSIIGEFIFTVFTLSFDMFGIFPLKEILHFIFISYSIKLLVTIIGTVPNSYFVSLLKKYESIDVYARHIKFNPFKINQDNTA